MSQTGSKISKRLHTGSYMQWNPQIYSGTKGSRNRFLEPGGFGPWPQIAGTWPVAPNMGNRRAWVNYTNIPY